jgi:hypothetical protein
VQTIAAILVEVARIYTLTIIEFCSYLVQSGSLLNLEEFLEKLSAMRLGFLFDLAGERVGTATLTDHDFNVLVVCHRKVESADDFIIHVLYQHIFAEPNSFDQAFVHHFIFDDEVRSQFRQGLFIGFDVDGCVANH